MEMPTVKLGRELNLTLLVKHCYMKNTSGKTERQRQREKARKREREEERGKEKERMKE